LIELWGHTSSIKQLVQVSGARSSAGVTPISYW